MFSQASVILSTGEHIWQGVCMAVGYMWQGGVHGREACMAEGIHGRGCMCGGGHVWWGHAHFNLLY